MKFIAMHQSIRTKALRFPHTYHLYNKTGERAVLPGSTDELQYVDDFQKNLQNYEWTLHQGK